MGDSSGWAPKKGAQVTFLFGANGEAFIYSADATEALADPGTYSYAGGRLSIEFRTPDINVNTTFALSTTPAEVKMPFQVFSQKPGTSLWKRESVALDQGIYAVFNAEGNAATGNPTVEQAAGLAYDYAEAWMAAGSAGASGPSRSHAVRAGNSHLRARSTGALLPRAGACSAGGANCVSAVKNLGTDIEVFYKDGPPVVLDLYSWGTAPGAPDELQDSPLASDPRVYLDPSVHPDGQFDPAHKSAVLISPFTYTVLPWPEHTSLEKTGDISDMASVLRGRGYAVQELVGAASVQQIVSALKPGPGFVLFSTHGDEDGDLLTGETVTAAAPGNAILQESRRLAGEGLQSLVDYGAHGGHPATFVLAEEDCSFLVTLQSFACNYHIMLTPLFWAWLTGPEHTSFATSLVFISACLTDSTPVLRNAIRAKAYFAFQKSVAAKLALAIEKYLVESLARPTHSPEEAYYNLSRIDKTHLMIYKEDHLLEGVLGNSGSQEVSYNLDGWGWNGTKLVRYFDSGWLGGKDLDIGQVWWMLYAARWDTSALDGAAALTRCLDTYWIKGNPGGLADEFCNSANAGQLANTQRLRNDVAYAKYLLDGEQPTGFPSDSIVPRWTMDDSG